MVKKLIWNNFKMWFKLLQLYFTLYFKWSKKIESQIDIGTQWKRKIIFFPCAVIFRFRLMSNSSVNLNLYDKEKSSNDLFDSSEFCIFSVVTFLWRNRIMMALCSGISAYLVLCWRRWLCRCRFPWWWPPVPCLNGEWLDPPVRKSQNYMEKRPKVTQTACQKMTTTNHIVCALGQFDFRFVQTVNLRPGTLHLLVLFNFFVLRGFRVENLLQNTFDVFLQFCKRKKINYVRPRWFFSIWCWINQSINKSIHRSIDPSIIDSSIGQGTIDQSINQQT